MNWAQLHREAPELAEEGTKRFTEQLLGLLGTIRKDGAPRICPIEVILAGGELCMGMAPSSRKAQDLRRDSRCTVHTVVTHRNGKEGEFKVSGRVREIDDESLFDAFADAMQEKVGWRPKFKIGFFVHLDISSASYALSPSQELMMWSKQTGFRRGKPA